MRPTTTATSRRSSETSGTTAATTASSQDSTSSPIIRCLSLLTGPKRSRARMPSSPRSSSPNVISRRSCRAPTTICASSTADDGSEPDAVMSHLVALAPVAPIGAHQLLVFLLQVGSSLLLAFLLGRLAAKAGMPAIVGELCAGVLAGPSVLAHVSPAFYHWLLPHDPAQFHLLDAAGQIGVLLLVGLTGIYMDLGLVRRRGTTPRRRSGARLLIPLRLTVTAGSLLPASISPVSAGCLSCARFLRVAS